MSDDIEILTENQVKDWLENHESEEFEENINDYDPSDIAAEARTALKTAQHLYKELNRMKRYAPIGGWVHLDVPSIGPPAGFQHEIFGRPSAEAEFSEDEKEVRISVYFLARHWQGDDAVRICAQPILHAMGFIVPAGDFWTVGPKCETPYRRCGGRNCGEELKLLDGENRRLFEQLERERHANAILMDKLESVGHPVTQEDLKKMVISLPLEGEDGKPDNQAT